MKKDGMCIYESKQLVYFRLVIYEIGISKKRRMVTLSVDTESHLTSRGKVRYEQERLGIISRNACHSYSKKRDFLVRLETEQTIPWSEVTNLSLEPLCEGVMHVGSSR